MRKHLIKYKVTTWYMIVLIAIVLLLISSILALSKQYITQEAKTELNDEVNDLCKKFLSCDDILAEIMNLHFYDDGVILSIYNKEETLLDGIHPDDFPVNLTFSEGKIREVKENENFWLVLDQSIINQGRKYCIRGVYTLNLIDGMTKKVISYMLLMVPFLIIFTAYIGYRLIQKSLEPIFFMTKTVNNITKSSDLSLRVPNVTSKDELGYLSETFNYMLKHLEDIFNREVQFTSDAAHELRTPISVIISHCEYCLSDLELSEQVREELDIISQKAVRMSDMVSQLLLIARAESNRFKPDFEQTDIRLLTETVLEELQEKADDKKIRLKLNCTQQEVIINCDFNLMMRLLINLIENAIQYGRKEGFVDVTIQCDNEQCLIKVRDDGIGIPDEAQDKIWNRFYRVDSSHSAENGFGLGLFMVKWIVTLHQGTIELKSSTELGSIFNISIPM